MDTAPLEIVGKREKYRKKDIDAVTHAIVLGKMSSKIKYRKVLYLKFENETLCMNVLR